jgi:UDP-glucose 4-epimerase
LAGDVSTENLDLLGEKVGQPSLIVNLAGGSSVGPSLEAPLGDFERTVGVGVRVLNWTWKNAPAAHLSFASSAAVYGAGHEGPISETASLNPLSPYGHHKLMMEASVRFWGQAFGIRSAIVRLFSVYGPGLQKQLIYDLSTRLAASPREIILSGTGDEMRDWLWIGDAARMMIDVGALASAEVPVLNGCTGTGTPIREVAEHLIRLWGGRSAAKFSGVSRPGDPINLYGNASTLVAKGIRAEVVLRDGLASMVADWRREDMV